MKVVVHLSDLRLGAEHPSAIPLLRAELEAIEPALIVVSGDVSQRGAPRQFQAAREFLRQLPGARLVVPGDRDQPMLNPYLRFLKPLHRFRRLVCSDLRPWVANEELAALGMNTTRPINLRAGKFSFDQLGHVRTRLLPLGAGRLKILVTHHPLLAPRPQEPATVDWTASSHQAVAMIERCQLDLLLAGHAPARSAGTAHLYRLEEGHAVIAIQAGAPLLAENRQRQPAYNVVEVAPDLVVVRQRLRRGDRFIEGKVSEFIRRQTGWQSA